MKIVVVVSVVERMVVEEIVRGHDCGGDYDSCSDCGGCCS